MTTCDALVVGGGPGGSTCAAELRRAGLDVLLLDRAAFPRDKPCAGWVTPQVLDALALAPEEYAAEGRVLQPITSLRTGSIGGPAIETCYERPVSFGVRRCEFDQYLLRRSGARTRTATPVTRLRREGTGWIVNEDVRAPVLVGAGGHFCPVARFLTGNGRSEPVVAAQEVEFPIPPGRRCVVRGEVPELYFCPDGRGYGWCFRKGDHLNVGFGRLDRGGLLRQVADFVRWLQDEGRIPADLPAPFKGHAYLLYESAPRPLFGEGVLLVGDAAGLAYGQSGEGIRPAVESGLLAARTIVGAGGRYGCDDLAPYAARIEARLGRRSSRLPLLPLVPSGLVAWLAGYLLASPWFTCHVLLDRCFLHADQPALGA